MEASGVLLAVACCAAMVTGLCLVHEAQSFARAQRRAQSMAQQAGASDQQCVQRQERTLQFSLSCAQRWKYCRESGARR